MPVDSHEETLFPISHCIYFHEVILTWHFAFNRMFIFWQEGISTMHAYAPSPLVNDLKYLLTRSKTFL